MTLVRRTLAERFWPKVKVAGPDDCWDWQGARFPNGYGYLGQIRETGNGPFVPSIRATHAALLVGRGELVPPGACVCHTCDRPICVNPQHLWIGSRAENNEDKVRKGRSHDRRGPLNSRAKLTPDQVIELRALRQQGWTQIALAEKFGVSQPHVSRLVRGENYIID